MAMQMLGFELPAGYTYEQMAAQESNGASRPKRRQSCCGKSEKRRRRRKSLTIRHDAGRLSKWERLALRRHKEGKSLDYPFESEAIPNDLKASIQGALLLAGSEQEVRAAFKPLPFHRGWDGYP